MHRYLIIIFIIWLPKQAGAQQVYTVNTQYPVQVLDSVLMVYQDSLKSHSLNDLISDTSLVFRPLKQFPKYLDPRHAYWGRVAIVAPEGLQGWKLHLEDRYFMDIAWIRGNGKVDVYGVEDGKVLFHKKSGSLYPESEREVPKPYFLNQIPLDLPAGDSVELLIRVEGNRAGFPPFFNLSLRNDSHANYYPLGPWLIFFRTFLLGICFIILLYHLVHWFYLRQRIYILFSLWVFMCTLTMAFSDVFISDLFLGDLPEIRFAVWTMVSNGILFTFWFFGREYINSPQRFPVHDKVILGICVVLGLEILYSVWYILAGGEVYFAMVAYHYHWVVGCSIVGLVLAVSLMFKKDQFAKYFGIGAILATSASLVGGFWSLRLFRLPFEPYSAGVFLQLVAYTFGIAYRQQQLSKKAEAEKLRSQEAQAEVQRVKDLEEIKSRFFSNVSHEFRTPLSLILGPIELAQKENLQSHTNRHESEILLPRKSWEVIKNNALRLEQLVDQVLNIARMKDGQVFLNLQKGGLVRFIRTVVYSFESSLEQKRISFNVSFPPEDNQAYYDKDKLEKIISNLISNAIKYTPEGGKVTVSIQLVKKHLVIEIADTGEGVSKENLPKIFERFYRIEGTEEKGTGIGLALTKELVDLHNGQISVKSTAEKGSTFKVRLPVSLEDLPEESVVVEDQHLPVVEYHQPQLMHSEQETTEVLSASQPVEDLPVALIVEDNQDLQNFIVDVLSGNYLTLTASDGEQGERLAIEHIPDIVISDIMMPRKDGYSLCHSMKNNPKTSHIPIILLTARAAQENKMEGLMQGADAYLTKPFYPDELLLRMKNLIEARKKLWEHLRQADLLVDPDLEIQSADNQFLQQVFGVIQENLDNERLSMDDLARAVGFSRSQLHRKIKALTGKSANQIVVDMRLREAHRLLKNKAGTVSEIAYSVGYSNLSYFTKSFREKFGVLPSKVAQIEAGK